MDHDEDDLPVVSLPNLPITKRISNDNNEENHIDNNPSNKFIQNWRNLYETSLNSLQSDDEDQRSFTEKPLYIDQPPPPQEKPPQQRPYSPIYRPSLDLNIPKSKWEIRLPQLLNGTVGPDRQKRDPSRRYTTNVVFQLSNSYNQDINPYNSSEANDSQSISPIVKQLKQKFDQMLSHNTTNDSIRNRSQYSSNNRKIHRVASLSTRSLSNDNDGRSSHRSRLTLPIRPNHETNTFKPRSSSSETVNSRTTITNNRLPRDKSGPPVSYPRYFYPPPSTTSVVKQLIGSGATLVYDSMTQKNKTKAKPSTINRQKSIDKTKENLKNTNTVLTGRQLPSNSSDDYIITERKQSNESESTLSKEDKPGDNVYEAIVDQSSSYLSSTPLNRNRSKSLSRPIDTNENETENYYPNYDMSSLKGDYEN